MGRVAAGHARMQPSDSRNRRAGRRRRDAEKHQSLASGLGPAGRLVATGRADVRSAPVKNRRPPRAAYDASWLRRENDALSSVADATRLLSTWSAGAGNGRSLRPAPPLSRADRAAFSARA